MLICPDTETCLIDVARAAPPMVCTTWDNGHMRDIRHAKWGAYDLWDTWLDDTGVRLVGANMAYDMAVVSAQWPEMMPRVFATYEQHRIGCIQVNQRLLDIANGCLGGGNGRGKYTYSLKAIASRTIGLELDKSEDTWRMRYSELMDVHCEDWPSDALQYAMDDATATWRVANWQLNKPEQSELLRDNWQQAYHAFVLFLMTCRGIRTDEKSCKLLIRETQKEIDRCFGVCERAGLIKQSKAGKWTKQLSLARKKLTDQLPPYVQERLAEAVAEHKAYKNKSETSARAKVAFDYCLTDKQYAKAERRLAKLLKRDISHKQLLKAWPYDVDLYRVMRGLVRKPRPFNMLGVRLTKTGMTSVDAEACRLSNDPTLQALATYTSANTLLQKSQRMLKGAFMPLQTSYTVCMSTGRTSSRASDAPLVGDNFQNFRRGNMELDDGTELPGQRECIVARKGYVLCSIDFDAAEMRAYAELEYRAMGDSPLREILNAGRSPHRAVGADILGISYDDMERRYKAEDAEAVQAVQYAKVPNFALLGGGGYKILPDYAAAMKPKVELTPAHAKELAAKFYAFNVHIKKMHKIFGSYVHKVYEYPDSKRLRYLDRHAQACNGPFQGHTASAALHATCRVAKEQYIPSGKLWGSYSLLFMHDEIVFEMPEHLASVHAWRATKIMCDAFTEWTPNVPMTAQPALMRRLAKGAKTVTHPTKKDSDGNKLLLCWEDA